MKKRITGTELIKLILIHYLMNLDPPPAGGRDPEDPTGGGEEEGGDVPLPGDAERHPDSDGAAQREERQPAAGERRAGRETQEALRAVQAAGRGEDLSSSRLRSAFFKPPFIHGELCVYVCDPTNST